MARPHRSDGIDPARFWARVQMTDSCWEWSGARTLHGYGKLQVRPKMVAAHRLAWELSNGPIPDGLAVLHRCDNPPCCNPAHLFLGTNADNIADRIEKGRPRPLNRRYSDDLIRALRLRYAQGAKQVDLQREFGMPQSSVRNIVKGLTWRWVS